MTITSTLMLSIGSVMLLAAKAIPDAKSPAASTITAAQALEPLVAELQYAASVNNRSATMIEFTVADRDGNDVPETIRYQWSGTPGDPLTRTCNAGPAVPVLADVREFALSYDLSMTSTEIPQTNESAETVLMSYNSLLYQDSYPIKGGEWYGQYFFPTLPVDAVSWKVTRVQLHARADGAQLGEARIQLQLPTAGKLPSGVVLEEETIVESSLLWVFAEQEFAFSEVSGLSPQQGLCIVVKWISDAVACRLLGVERYASSANRFLLKSTSQGLTWSAPAGESLIFTVYGRVTTAGTPQIQTTYYLDAVGIRLRTGSDTQATIQTAVRMPNRPEVTE